MGRHAWWIALVLMGCGGPTDGEPDASRTDAATDGSTPFDANDPADASDPADAHDPADATDLPDGTTAADATTTPDAGSTGPCRAMDVRMGRPCGPTERPGPAWLWNGDACEVVYWCDCDGADCGSLYHDEAACTAAYASCTGNACTSDAECARGSEWCEGGRCVACDNSGTLCFIACPGGWSTYQRNGCSPCECAPPLGCADDSECSSGQCYAGALCWEGCAAGDPACCRGNECGAPGCAAPSPEGCRTRGCPRGQRCDTEACASSECICGPSGDWTCTRDCGGGVCVPE